MAVFQSVSTQSSVKGKLSSLHRFSFSGAACITPFGYRRKAWTETTGWGVRLGLRRNRAPVSGFGAPTLPSGFSVAAIDNAMCRPLASIFMQGTAVKGRNAEPSHCFALILNTKRPLCEAVKRIFGL